jgi:ArsR family transcriptional regulator, lead/cadmium/zinc/bismuth-responsive transcriptional repressor
MTLSCARVAIERDTCELLCLDLPKAEAARHRLPAPQALEGWAAGAKALGDPTRLAVAIALAESGSACVCDLAWIVARDEKLVSHHVRALRTAGLAASTRQGKMVMYELTGRGRALLAAVTDTAPVRA